MRRLPPSFTPLQRCEESRMKQGREKMLTERNYWCLMGTSPFQTRMLGDYWKQTACKYTFMHTLSHLMEWNWAGMEAAWKWCNWLFQFSVLTLAVPSSFRLMMSKSKSLLRPSVLLRTMCPVSPSHCAYWGEAAGERNKRCSGAKHFFSFFFLEKKSDRWLRTRRMASAGDSWRFLFWQG